ncbi:zinc ABC transporter ATP-binding protein AztA [Nocardioides albus]|uniref:Zinc/manganese transport system ATP-binding protein n=1 Tax=Nocardioides albus TaxID=1841 RepID=A0A7W5A6H7_9ACTN|nr:zinc ABC transporter ATP-binding protein AztA [Nocardioides albus]MBB3090517.1 zinc/manganese transport system ATP-binding protein [Nocardioides albus]
MLPSDPTDSSHLSARSLCFGYDGQDVLHDVSARFTPGTVTAVAGPNGSGKSTFVELLAGVRGPRRGTVDRRGRLALVVQRPSTPDALPVTVQDVVAIGTWGRQHRRDRQAGRQTAIAEAIGRVDLTGLERRTFGELSGGQRQRALLAQGIVQNAEILLLDEPAAGLDAGSRGRTREILTEEAARGATVVCVTHDEESIAAAEHVIRFEDGRIVG